MVHAGGNIGDSDWTLYEILAVSEQQDQNWILCYGFLAAPPGLPSSVRCFKNPLSSSRDKKDRNNIHMVSFKHKIHKNEYVWFY